MGQTPEIICQRLRLPILLSSASDNFCDQFDLMRMP
jgi:hypothetical protein